MHGTLGIGLIMTLVCSIRLIRSLYWPLLAVILMDNIRLEEHHMGSILVGMNSQVWVCVFLSSAVKRTLDIILKI